MQVHTVKSELSDGTVVWSVVLVINTVRPEDKEIIVHIPADSQVHARHIKHAVEL